MTGSIPLIIHQTWRNSEIPDQWREFQKSWQRLHPNFEYKLWTDLDFRKLILDHYSWFLPIYDNYSKPIERVDAARYFLMHRHGGVYVDLDFECLRSIENLLSNREVILGLEPQAHAAKAAIKSVGLESVACNAFMASVPQSPFWEHIFLQLIGSHKKPDTLHSTGPIMLTQALQSYQKPESITCLEPSILYPGTSDDAQAGLLGDPTWREQNTKDSYAIHHWSGSWIPADPPSDETIWLPIQTLNRGRQTLSGQCALQLGKKVPFTGEMISCLMVTHSGRLEFVKISVTCFQAQTYPAKELVIVDDGPSDELAQYIHKLNDAQITHIRLPQENCTLGQLRNIAVARASGSYVMQWDDDDLYHPRRIEAQSSVLHSTSADACVLSRWNIWWPHLKRIATSKRRGWEGSILCAKDKLPHYDETKRRGEDTPVLLKLASTQKVTFVDAPWLYTYIVHGENTTPSIQNDEHWAQGTDFCWGPTYLSGLNSIAAALPHEVAEVIHASH